MMRTLALFLLLVLPAALCASPVTDPVAGGVALAPNTIQRARAILDDALRARNPDTRREAVLALGLIGPREPYMTRLMVMLKDDDVPVRVAAIASLVDLRDNRALPAIRNAYDDPVPEVSFAAAKGLQAMGDPVGRSALMDVVGGGDDSASGYVTTNTRAAKRLYYAPKAVLPYLMSRAIGFAHVSGLGTGIASLEGLLADQNISGRASAVIMLGADKDPRVIPALRHALHDKDSSVRAAAVHAIALRDDASLEPDLLPLLDEKNVETRVRAAAGCLRLELVASEAQAAAASMPATTAGTLPLARRVRSHR
jgi:HEAT repeat protein